jgi:hypothetical protein
MSCRSGGEALGLSFVLPSGGFEKTVDLKKAIGERSDLNRYTGSKIRAVQNARKVIQEGA